MNSLHVRLTAWFTSLLVVVGLLGGLGAYFLARHDPDKFLDDQLRQIAHFAGDKASESSRSGDATFDPDDIVLVQIWDGDGRLVRSSPPGIDLPREARTGFYDLTTPTESWRTYTLVAGDRTVQVSQRAEVRQELAINAALPAMLPSAFLIPLSWLLVRWLVRRVLRPLDVLVRELSARGPDSMRPLPPDNVPVEIAPLVAAMNSALARLGAAYALQSQFISDAAHQLRTPLTALRLQVQNLRRASPEHAPELVEEMDSGLKRMSALTGQLLTLARAEAAAPARSRDETVLLNEVLTEAVGTVLTLARERGIEIEATSLDKVAVRGRRHDVLMLLSNLIDNAVRYTPAQGKVTVCSVDRGDTAIAEVADTGPGLPENMLETVFERFARCSEGGDGTGLGLAIVRAVADRLAARVNLRNREDGPGLTARVEFPSGYASQAPTRASAGPQGPGQIQRALISR